MQATETQYNGHRPQARNGHGAPALTQQLNGTADIESGWSPRLPYNIDVEQALLGAILFETRLSIGLRTSYRPIISTTPCTAGSSRYSQR